MAQMQKGVHEDVRVAINRADELSRSAHEAHHEPVAQALDSLRTALIHVDEALGGGHSALPMVPELIRIVDDLASFSERVAPEVRTMYRDALVGFRGLVHQLERDLEAIAPSLELPSKPLLGKLPLARVLPQDLHSMMDYASGATCLATSLMADSTSGKVAGAALGASVVCVSALTDYRLSAAKLIPIEAHEAIDHLWGLGAIIAPFALGYWKKDPAVAAIHVMTGASTILASLFTDYRAAKGVGRSVEEIDALLREGA